MTQPIGFGEDPLDALKLLAPPRRLDFQDESQQGPFGLQAFVGFVEDEPNLKIVVRAYSEATDLSEDQIARLDSRARDLRVGFAHYISAGKSPFPEQEAVEPDDDVDPKDPLSLIIEFSFVDSRDPFVQRLLRSSEMLTIVDPTLRRDESDVYRFDRARSMTIRVHSGSARFTAKGKGSEVVSAGDLCSKSSRKFRVRGLASYGTSYTKY